ncbi:MAG TPA: hypothetical protein VGR53_09980 [Nitrososphaerales archaeon]|nr:hypothetical protein [Nitrososphaerales archaeon]
MMELFELGVLLRFGTAFQVVAGFIVPAAVLIGTYWSLLTFGNQCAPLNLYFLLGVSVIPNLVIGLVSILGRARAFGLTVIVV